MIANRSYHGGEVLTLLFRIDHEEEREALCTFRAAFGAGTDIEAITEYLMALHIWPGQPGCPCDDEWWGNA